MSGIDLNRAGTPLLEIVTEPDMRSSDEAVAYAKQLHALVQWVGICDGNMQEGSFRCDANVSVRRAGEPLGTRCEIKNLNSFRFMQEAIDFEVRRQIALIEDGGRVVQETRLYDPDRHETRSMRSKEDAQDYRYFPDPDLPPLVIAEDWIKRVKAESMPELPEAMDIGSSREHGITDYDATLLTASRGLVDYYEQAVKALQAGDAPANKLVANWVLGEFSAALHKAELDIADAPVAATQLAGLLKRISDGTISGKIAKDVFDAMWAGEHGGERRHDHRGEGLDADFRCRRHREDRRRRDRRQPRHRRRSAGRQGKGIQLAGRQGDGRVEGEGQSGAGQRDPEAKALVVVRTRGGTRGRDIHADGAHDVSDELPSDAVRHAGGRR